MQTLSGDKCVPVNAVRTITLPLVPLLLLLVCFSTDTMLIRESHDSSRVIGVGVISRDSTLASVLSSVLGAEFRVLAAPGTGKTGNLSGRDSTPVEGNPFDVLILDFDSA